MNVMEIKEKLKEYGPRDCRVCITRVGYSGDEDFVFSPDITATTLREWGVRPFFCVDVTLSGGPGSEVHGEILIPEKDWNGKLVYHGNGGPARTFMQEGVLACLYEPYAVIHCDLGTADIDVGLWSASSVIDHGWRATHMMTVVGKDIVALVCGRPVEHSYLVGMSTGGQQAISAATNCPDDFDGIAAGAPGITRSYLHASFVWSTQHLVREDGTPKFTAEEITAIYNMILDYHSRKGYGAPGDRFVSVLFTEEERQEILAEIETSGIFTAEQMNALRAFYQGPVNPETGEKIFSGFTMGAECAMMGMMGHIDPEIYANQLWLGAWIAGMPNQDFIDGGYHQFDFVKDLDSPMMHMVINDMDADSGDLAAFKARGGKMIVWNGVVDEFVPAENTIEWYERVISKQGNLAATQDFCRMFIVPGLAHTPNPNAIDVLSDLDQQEERWTYFENLIGFCGAGLLHTLDKWVCTGVAPDNLMGTGYNAFLGWSPVVSSGIARQRPVYPYPDQTEYVSGDPNLPTSFRRRKGQLGNYIKPRAERYMPK